MREWLRQLVKIQRSAEAATGRNRGWSKYFQSPGTAGLFGPLELSDADGRGPSAFCTYRLTLTYICVPSTGLLDV